MALFKILKGNKLNLPAEKHEGYAYFCEDTHEFYIDHLAADGVNIDRSMIRSDTIHWHVHTSGSNDAIGQESIKNEFHVHSVPDQATYDAIEAAGGIVADHMYLIEGEEDTKINVTQDNNSTLYVLGVPTNSDGKTISYNSNIYIDGVNDVLYGAAWNDYAEYRICYDLPEAGRVVCENGDDTLSLAMERLQPGAYIVSDTFGMAIGKTNFALTPVTVSGRVLAYTWENRVNFAPGDPVCAAPNGTVSKMTREEVREYPDRIIGTVSAVPTYDFWNRTIKVDDRIWIKIK